MLRQQERARRRGQATICSFRLRDVNGCRWSKPTKGFQFQRPFSPLRQIRLSGDYWNLRGAVITVAAGAADPIFVQWD